MGRPVRVLAIGTNPETGASTRFRVIQWAPYLERAGFTLSLDAFYSPAAADVLYRRGRHVAKLAHFIAGTVRRFGSLVRAPREADLLLVHREAFPLGRRVFFSRLQKFPGPIVYDYDDAMFLPQRQDRGILARLEELETPKRIMGLSQMVLAGNRFLANYAERYAKRVMVLATCIDTEKFRPSERPRTSDRCVVGWIGSHSTAKYLRSLESVIERAAARHRLRLYVVGSSDHQPFGGADVRYATWSLGREVEDFANCDIGIYPLWDDPWTRGKCGFKAIQFMACGVPVVAAAVGVNREIIEDGVNGFLASTESEWEEKLGWLLTDPRLREKLGQAGRRTIEERYSLNAHAPTLISALREAVSNGRRIP